MVDFLEEGECGAGLGGREGSHPGRKRDMSLPLEGMSGGEAGVRKQEGLPKISPS